MMPRLMVSEISQPKPDIAPPAVTDVTESALA